MGRQIEWLRRTEFTCGVAIGIGKGRGILLLNWRAVGLPPTSCVLIRVADLLNRRKTIPSLKGQEASQ
jgi:hypothetical protein